MQTKSSMVKKQSSIEQKKATEQNEGVRQGGMTEDEIDEEIEDQEKILVQGKVFLQEEMIDDQEKHSEIGHHILEEMKENLELAEEIVIDHRMQKRSFDQKKISELRKIFELKKTFETIHRENLSKDKITKNTKCNEHAKHKFELYIKNIHLEYVY